MRGVFLDTDTLKLDELNTSALTATLDEWQLYRHTCAHETIERARSATVIVTNKVVIDADVIAACPALKLICVSATGTNNIDHAAAAARGIAVCNVSGYASASVAQHTFALMLALATRWHEYNRDVRNGEWSRASQFCLLHRPVTELAGKTLGIVGYGDLGQAVARLATAFGMQVLVAESRQHGVQPVAGETRVTMAELLPQCDVISLHCPLTADNQGMVNCDWLTNMKPGAWLINTARGGLIDEPALAQSLRDGHLGAAALDVLSVEPPPEDHPLLASDIPNLIITPHNAWISRECRQRLLDGVVANIEAHVGNGQVGRESPT